MKNRLRALALGLFVALAITLSANAPSRANGVPTQSFCLTPSQLDGMLLQDATPLLSYGMGCGLQPGDLFTDGPVYGPGSVFSFTGGSLGFTIPAMSWVVLGNRAYTASTPETATASATNYYFLDCNQCSGVANATWDMNTTGTVPFPWDVLMYTVVASGTGITSVTFPSQSAFVLGGTTLTESNLTATNPNPTLQWSLPTIFNNSASAVTSSVAAFLFNESNPNCTSSGSLATDELLAIQANGTNVFSQLCNGNASFANIVSANAFQAPSRTTLSSAAYNSGFAGTQTLNVMAWGAAVLGDYMTLQTSSDTLNGITCSGIELLDHAGGTAWCMDSNGAATSAGELWAGHSLHSNRSVIGGANTAPSPVPATYGDGFFSRSVSTGNFCAGGTTSSGCIDYGVTTAGTLTANVPFAVAAGNAAPNSSAIATPSPGPTAAAATGSTANTYQTLATITSPTLGTSNGPQGKWFGEVTVDLVTTGSTTEAVYGCLESSSTLTTISRTLYPNSTPPLTCDGSPTGALAGAGLFGLTAAPGSLSSTTENEIMLSSRIEWSGTAASGTAPVFTVNVAGNNTTSLTVYGAAHAFWVPI